MLRNMFRKCPHRNNPDSSDFFHWYIEQYVPRLWAALQRKKAERRAARAPAATLAAVPVSAPAAAAAAAPAAAPAFVPTPRSRSRPSRTAFTFVTQISVLETSVDPPLTTNPMPLAFVSTLPHITIMLYPGVSIPVVFDTGSGVNLMSLSLLRWLQLVAPSAIVRVYDCDDDCYPFSDSCPWCY